MLDKIKLYFKRRELRRHRLGQFWCDKHWQVIENSLSDLKPIDPSVSAIGITMALYLKDPDSSMPTNHACCKIPSLLMDGIFERSKVESFEEWKKIEWQMNQTLLNGTINKSSS